jgi:hypothetical protein
MSSFVEKAFAQAALFIFATAAARTWIVPTYFVVDAFGLWLRPGVL